MSGTDISIQTDTRFVGLPDPTAEEQLEVFLGEFDSAVARVAREAVEKLRRILPGATVMVYDNYNALAIGFSPTDRPSDAILSIAVFPRYAVLCFLFGRGLPDPEGLLKGDGNQVRNIRLGDAGDLERPSIRELIAAAVRRSPQPFPPAPGRLVVRSISAKRRPRRP